MAAKRLRIESDNHESDQPEDKQMRRLPSFATVIREAVIAKYLHNFGLVLEPLIREWYDIIFYTSCSCHEVREEVEHAIVRASRLFQRSPQMQLEAAEASSGLQLIFKNPLSLPIFTGSKIEDAENNPLQLLLVDTCNRDIFPVTPSSPIRVEIVVIDGDFPSEDHQNWTSADFNKRIVKERTGRRPLITGDVALALREGLATITELTFTDNSSWIRGRQFKIGARVVPESYKGPRIKEALTEPFMVKDHRGELYRKHYPPSLKDEVWRLDRIGKDGVFHRKLTAEDITTVQDFLKLWSVDPDKLRRILGMGMSDRMWEGTIGHARTCLVGEKLYMYQGSYCSLILNPVCQVLGIVIDGTVYHQPDDLSRSQRDYVQQLVREAYKKWDTMEEAEHRLLGGDTVLQGDIVPQMANGSTSECFHQQVNTTTSQYEIWGFGEEGIQTYNLQIGSSCSTQNPASMIHYW